MLGANVLVEKVFAWPGLGSFALEALVASDYAAIQGFVLTMTMLFVVLNLLIDILYTLDRPADRGLAADHDVAFARHFRYVMGENPVTAVALCMVSVLVTSLPPSSGTALAPYDPIVTDTARALQPPERPSHWFGTDNLGRDVFSRVLGGGPARPRHRGRRGRSLSLAIGSVLGDAVGLLRRLARPHRRPDHGHHHGVPACSCLPWESSRRSATRWKTSSMRRR